MKREIGLAEPLVGEKFRKEIKRITENAIERPEARNGALKYFERAIRQSRNTQEIRAIEKAINTIVIIEMLEILKGK
ncbi:MAG: hypothetical protein ACP5TJ_00225 [Candidatus Micrarchaeia archaeon]